MGCERVISSPDQAQPYPGTSGTAGAHFDRPCGQTLAVPKNPCSPKGADRGDDDLTPCHWRAINRGEKRLSVARGHFAPQVRRPRSLNATERGCDVGRIDGRCRADTSAPPSGCGCGLIWAVRPRTIDAYARGLAEYLQVCERDGTDPLTAQPGAGGGVRPGTGQPAGRTGRERGVDRFGGEAGERDVAAATGAGPAVLRLSRRRGRPGVEPGRPWPLHPARRFRRREAGAAAPGDPAAADSRRAAVASRLREPDRRADQCCVAALQVRPRAGRDPRRDAVPGHLSA